VITDKVLYFINVSVNKSFCQIQLWFLFNQRRDIIQIYRQHLFGCFRHGERLSCIFKKSGDLKLIENRLIFYLRHIFWLVLSVDV